MRDVRSRTTARRREGLLRRAGRAWARGWLAFVASTADSQPPLAGPEPWRRDARGPRSRSA